MAPDPLARWCPVPLVVTRPKDMAHCHGMRMGHAPLLALLEPDSAEDFKRLALIGIPCQMYALRALEAALGLERLYFLDAAAVAAADGLLPHNLSHLRG